MKLYFLGLAYLLVSLGTCQGAGTYTVSSRVIPAEAKRQGLGQQSPCPGDRVVFTCLRNDSSGAAVRWTANGTPLYTFGIPVDIGTPAATQTGFDGLIGTLVNSTVFTLTVDLTTSMMIQNGTGVACGEVVTGTTSEILNLFIIGQPSAPSSISSSSDGVTGLIVNVTIPDINSICVDEFRAYVEGVQTVPSVTTSVVDASNVEYSFRFPVDLCRVILSPQIRLAASAVTNGVSGPNITGQGPVDMVDRNRLIMSVYTAQFFTAEGIQLTLINNLIDPNLVAAFNISCLFIETPAQITLNCDDITIGEPSIAEQTVLVPYDAGLMENNATFRLSYRYHLCSDSEVVDISVGSINSSAPQLVQNMRVVTVLFDENLFDIQSVRVMLTSNCTQSVVVDYANPVLIDIPSTGMNTGQCRYTIQVIDGNNGQIGFPLTGFFVAEELPAPASQTSAGAVGAIIAVLTIVIVIVVVVVVFAMVGYTYMKKRKVNVVKKTYGYEIENSQEQVNSEATENEMLEDDGTSSMAERKSELTTSMLLGPSHSEHSERKLSATIDKKELTSSVLLNSANHQEDRTMSFSTDDFELFRERMKGRTTPTEIVNVKTGAAEVAHADHELNYATVEVTPVSGRTTPVQQYPPIEYSTVVSTFKF